MKKLFTILLFLISVDLLAVPTELTFMELQKTHYSLNNRDPKKVLSRELKSYHGKDISIRGFVFESPGGDWVLADKPGLKSCCIGSEKEVFSQVYLECQKEPTFHNQQVVVTGNFNVDVLENTEGKFVRIYTLQNAEVQKVSRRKIPTVTIFALVAISLLFFVKKRTKKKIS